MPIPDDAADTNKVFFSWQDDLTPAHHHFFVRDALRDAVDQIAEADGVDDAPRPEIDHDTLDVPGSPEIVATIHRKIDGAAVFVADVTPVGMTDPAANRPRMEAERRPPPKHLPNPNVMDELGRADRAIGANRVVTVANAHYYPGPEALPFDWRHRRGPVTYRLEPEATASQVKAERAVLARALVERLRPALAAAQGDRPAPPPILARPPLVSDPALWAGTETGVVFNVDGRQQRMTARLPDGPRLFVRLRAKNWTNATRVELRETMLRDNVLLWISAGGPTNGWTGVNTDGAFAASHGEQPSPTEIAAKAFTQWFMDDGEIWAVDTVSFLEQNGEWTFTATLPLGFIAAFIKSATEALRARAPDGPIEIEIGATGLTRSSMTTGMRTDQTFGVADRVSARRTDTAWSPATRNALLLDFWNQLMDAYGRPALASVEALESAARVVLSR